MPPLAWDQGQSALSESDSPVQALLFYELCFLNELVNNIERQMHVCIKLLISELFFLKVQKSLFVFAPILCEVWFPYLVSYVYCRLTQATCVPSVWFVWIPCTFYHFLLWSRSINYELLWYLSRWFAYTQTIQLFQPAHALGANVFHS